MKISIPIPKIPRIRFPLKIPIPTIRIVHDREVNPGEDEYVRINPVPEKLRLLLSSMNSYCATNNADIYLGREKEVTQIFNSLQKTATPNVLLIGEHGVGKSAITQSLVYHILRGECPDALKDFHFVFWNIEKTLAIMKSEVEGDKIKGIVGEAFNFLTSHTNIVVVIDQIHLMETSPILVYYLSTLVRRSNVKLIGMCTEEDYENFFIYDSKNLSLFDIIPIMEPRHKKVYPMTVEYIKCLETIHEVKISEDMVDYTISVSSAFDSELCNPGLTLNFIEKSMIVAKQKGHKEVTKEDVNLNFNFNYELYSQMSDEDKKITAYHEAGHFLVTRKSENIKNYKTTAITIVPSDYFLGVTLFEMEVEKQTSCDTDYYIDVIASDLAGRVAELILQEEDGTNKITSGAASDLKNATGVAREIVTEYGMLESCGQNMTYFCNYDLSDLALLSDERKKLIDQETQKLIDLAYKRAEEILRKNINLLHLIARELLLNEVLDEKDLEILCNHVEETA